MVLGMKMVVILGEDRSESAKRTGDVLFLRTGYSGCSLCENSVPRTLVIDAYFCVNIIRK